MPMTVLKVGYAFAPVSTYAVGGAEQILSQLDRVLVASGYQSIVVSCAGSKTSGTLYSFLLPAQPFDEKARLRGYENAQEALGRTLATHSVDLAHLHGLDAGALNLPLEIPVIITLHLPVFWHVPILWKRYAVSTHILHLHASVPRVSVSLCSAVLQSYFNFYQSLAHREIAEALYA